MQIHKAPYARYDGNDYTVPPEYVQQTLQIVAGEKQLRIMDGTETIARHERSYDKGERIEQEGHLEALRARKSAAASSAPNDRLRQAAPQTNALLEELARRGNNIGSAVAHLLRILDRFGGRELNGAIQTAMERETPNPSAVQMILEKAEQERGQLPRVEVDPPDDPRVRQLGVRPHSLADYDTFRSTDDSTSDTSPGHSDPAGGQV